MSGWTRYDTRGGWSGRLAGGVVSVVAGQKEVIDVLEGCSWIPGRIIRRGAGGELS